MYNTGFGDIRIGDAMTWTVFLAGIIQGSREGEGIHDQDYRARLKSVLEAALDGAQVYCPFENHPQSVGYDDDRARSVFVGHVEQARDTDIIVAYLPEASMGTAIEIWEAYRAERIVFTISPLAENWVIKLLGTRNFLTLEEFEEFVESGELRKFLENYER